MIIWGFKGIVQTLGSGVFFCPAEGSDQTYWHQRLRRWFTFFFLPIFPTSTISEHVQCASCGNAYYMSVLENTTVGDLSELLAIAVRSVAVAVTRADGPPSASQVTAAVDYVRSTVDDGYGEPKFRDDEQSLRSRHLEHASALAEVLNEHGKEQIVTAALHLAAVDGDISSEETEVVTDIAASLGMAPNHLRGTIQAFVEAATE